MTLSSFIQKHVHLLCGALLCVGLSSALALPPAGNIIVTERRLNHALSSFHSDLKTEAKKTLARPPENENWKLYFVAHLKKAAGDTRVNLVFYDASQPAKPGREPVHFAEINTQPTAKVLMSDVELRPDQGFKEGGKYQVLITRLINGKEEVYARTQVELK